MEEENTLPLVAREPYDEACPGCRLESRKRARHGVPIREFFFVCITTLCTSLPISSLYPFLYFMINDFHIAKRIEDIGYYAGFVGSAFMVGRASTSVLWGILADRLGRKPVILLGAISVIFLNIIFGLSSSYWMASAVRFVLGCLNGMLGSIKAFASEVCRPEHEPFGLSLITTSLTLGLIIGPLIGGFLAQPADKYPTVFTKESIFGRFPYFLPCLCVSVFATGVFLSCFWLPETLHKHKQNGRKSSTNELEACESDPYMNINEEKTAEESIFKNWPLMSIIAIYCMVSLHNTAYNEIFSLWAESDKSYGGLCFSTNDVGESLAFTGFVLLIFQLFLYHPVVKLLGPIASARTAMIMSIPLLSLYPLFTKFSGVELKMVVVVASIMKNVLSVTVINAMFILQNNAVKQNQRGTANGISMSVMSVFKAIAPASGGAIFAWTQKRQAASFLPGNHMVFFILNLVQLLSLTLTFKPFLMIRKKR